MIVVGACRCNGSVTIKEPEAAVADMRRHMDEEHPGEPLEAWVSFRHRGVEIPAGTIVGTDGQWRILA